MAERDKERADLFTAKALNHVALEALGYARPVGNKLPKEIQDQIVEATADLIAIEHKIVDRLVETARKD